MLFFISNVLREKQSYVKKIKMSSTSPKSSKSQVSSPKHHKSSRPSTKNSNRARVQIMTIDIPAPISNKYLTRKLIEPWRRTDKLQCVETQLPLNQIWIQNEQQMFELQALAKCRGVPDVKQPVFESPYPQ